MKAAILFFMLNPLAMAGKIVVVGDSHVAGALGNALKGSFKCEVKLYGIVSATADTFINGPRSVCPGPGCKTQGYKMGNTEGKGQTPPNFARIEGLLEEEAGGGVAGGQSSGDGLAVIVALGTNDADAPNNCGSAAGGARAKLVTLLNQVSKKTKNCYYVPPPEYTSKCGSSITGGQAELGGCKVIDNKDISCGAGSEVHCNPGQASQWAQKIASQSACPGGESPKSSPPKDDKGPEDQPPTALAGNSPYPDETPSTITGSPSPGESSPGEQTAYPQASYPEPRSAPGGNRLAASSGRHVASVERGFGGRPDPLHPSSITKRGERTLSDSGKFVSGEFLESGKKGSQGVPNRTIESSPMVNSSGGPASASASEGLPANREQNPGEFKRAARRSAESLSYFNSTGGLNRPTVPMAGNGSDAAAAIKEIQEKEFATASEPALANSPAENENTSLFDRCHAAHLRCLAGGCVTAK